MEPISIQASDSHKPHVSDATSHWSTRVGIISTQSALETMSHENETSAVWYEKVPFFTSHDQYTAHSPAHKLCRLGNSEQVDTNHIPTTYRPDQLVHYSAAPCSASTSHAFRVIDELNRQMDGDIPVFLLHFPGDCLGLFVGPDVPHVSFPRAPRPQLAAPVRQCPGFAELDALIHDHRPPRWEVFLKDLQSEITSKICIWPHFRWSAFVPLVM